MLTQEEKENVKKILNERKEGLKNLYGKAEQAAIDLLDRATEIMEEMKDFLCGEEDKEVNKS